MIKVHCFTSEGVSLFKDILTGKRVQSIEALLSDGTSTDPYLDLEIDESRELKTRFDLGLYLATRFKDIQSPDLLAPESDLMWAWINCIYFKQLTRKGIRRYEHYIPVRHGDAGSLLHRNAARTAYELVLVHGENARFALQQDIGTHGQLLESLSASQSIVRNKSFFAAAAKMYVKEDGKIKKGASAKAMPPNERKPGDESGKGSIRRLPVALRRLELTYDVDVIEPRELIRLLPREFLRWAKC